MEKETFIIQLVLDAWHHQQKIINQLLNELSDDQLMQEITPGKNRGIYILGHLTAVHDRMIPLLGLGDQLFPELNSIYIQTPDKTVKETPYLSSLRQQWTKVNTVLNEQLIKMTTEEWLQKHTSVTEVDFTKEPNRNKLNVLISRTNHLANHMGQLLLLV
jgi:hypothetical protein